MPLYQLFYDGEEPPELPNLPKRKSADDIAWGSTGKNSLSRPFPSTTWTHRRTGPAIASLYGSEVGEPLSFFVLHVLVIKGLKSYRCFARSPTGTRRKSQGRFYSHSIVLGGFELIS